MFKLSSACVSNGEGVNPEVMAAVARKIVSFTDAFGFNRSIVTGGFVNEGRHLMQELGLDISGVDDRVFAAKGIGHVQDGWDEAFKQYRTATGLIVVTHREIDDLGDPDHDEPGEGPSIKVAHRKTLAAGLIPLFNQNDAIASEEDKRNELTQTQLKKDNDRLAKHLGLHLGVQAVVFLTEDKWGYEENGEVRSTVTVAEVESGAVHEHVITDGKQSENGGIVSKLEECAELARAGIKAFIGNYMDTYSKIYTGRSGTQVIQ